METPSKARTPWFSDITKYYGYRILLKRFLLSVIVLYMLSHDITIAQIAMIVVVSRIVALALEIPSGMISDTLGHKKTLLLSLAMKVIAMSVYLFGTFEMFMLGTTLFWAAGAFASGTSDALFYERLEQLGRKDEFKLHEGRAVGIGQAVGIVTMFLAGWSYTINPDIPIVASSIQFAVAFLIMLTFTAAPQTKLVKEEEGYYEVFAHFNNAVKILKQYPQLFWIALIQGVVVGTAYGSYEFLQAILEFVGMGALAIGAYYAVERVLMMLAGFSASTLLDTYSEKALIRLFIVGSLIPLAGMIAVDEPLAVAAFLLISNVPTILFAILVKNRINQTIPSGSRATVISLSSMILSGVIMGTSAIFGLISSIYSPPNMVGIVALCSLGLATLFELVRMSRSRA